MTEKEAIEKLREEWDRFGKATPCDTSYGMIVNEAYKMAISALEKQIPKKPITYKETNRADCPICGATVRGIDKPFGDWCAKCGQAIDWKQS